MKRHPALVDLSREHQMALQLGVEAKRAQTPQEIAAMIEKCSKAFNEHFEAHFQQEEKRLVPPLKAAQETALLERFEQDHAHLRALAALLPNWGVTELSAFSETMLAHVRFEERQLFPRYEALFLTDNSAP